MELVGMFLLGACAGCCVAYLLFVRIMSMVIAELHEEGLLTVRRNG